MWPSSSCVWKYYGNSVKLMELKKSLPHWLAAYLGHDVTLAAQIFIAQTEKTVDDECCKQI